MRKEETEMRIVSMKKNKGTIEIETERRFYVIDF